MDTVWEEPAAQRTVDLALKARAIMIAPIVVDGLERRRPSQDLGKLSAKFEPRLPKSFRYMTRNLGAHKTESPDSLSLLMFQADYTRHLIEVGERDAESRIDEIRNLVSATMT